VFSSCPSHSPRLSFPTRRSSDLPAPRANAEYSALQSTLSGSKMSFSHRLAAKAGGRIGAERSRNRVTRHQVARETRHAPMRPPRSEEHTSELQSQSKPVCRLPLE